MLDFRREQGGNWYCEPLARQLTNLQSLDWLADHLTA